MRISSFAKVWFGVLFGIGAARVREEYISRRRAVERAEHFHGYTYTQVKDVLEKCYDARPDIREETARMDREAITRFVTGVFTCPSERFEREFGFRRPSPT